MAVLYLLLGIYPIRLNATEYPMTDIKILLVYIFYHPDHRYVVHF